MSIRVSIYEDNDDLRESLSYLVMGTGTFQLMGAYPDCSKVMENCVVAKPEVILWISICREYQGLRQQP